MSSPICHEPDGTVRAGPSFPSALLPGSFNPLHRGHLALAAAARRHLGAPVAFELSRANVDKPPLDDAEVARRVAQFRGVGPVWVTAAPTFAGKARLFPGTAFVVGSDTAERLIDPRYCGGDPAARDAVLAELFTGGCRVVVGGRVDAAGAFRVWDPGAVPGGFGELFVPLLEADFRADVSSTALRAGGRLPPPLLGGEGSRPQAGG
ncbi:MAG: hypothetical protein K2X87_33710 [Gemmataceae bacterium]|nr:hypothetical protein [Gemmataceae bacterium]